MKSFATFAFVGAVAAQANYAQPKGYEPQPPTYNAPPSYGQPPVHEQPSTTTKVTPPAYPTTTSKVTPPAYTTTTKVTPPAYPTTTTESIPSYPTSTCPAPGSYDSQGRYSCNPAHAYPTGQTCKLIDGCYYLEYPKTTPPTYPTTSKVTPPSYPTTTESKPVEYPTKSETKPAPYPTSSCPAPGDYDNKGRYSCNPAHAYPTGQTCKLIDGCYYLEYPKTTSTPPKYPTQPPPSYTTKVVTTDYETYCPQPTTFTHGPSTYTVTSATTITLPCKYGCTVTQPVYPHPTTVYKNTTVPVYGHPTTVTEVQPPKYTTKIETQLTTYCPEPTTITVKQSTYTVTSATTLVVPCPGGCTVTKEIPQPPKTYTHPVVPPTSPEQPHPAPPAETHPAPPAETYPVVPPTSPEQPQQPPVYAPTGSKPSTPVVGPSATTSRPPIATYTGAASQKVAGGMVAVAAAAAFFL
ncbi:hypothetical protein CBER1_02459 [Cercospora berteroae]|uniref:Uncharacterized protein n=1 Tax=Cercospora berteroae TaxID=357750 RepID=A0A2S6CIB2_9PEZI|nr:hypothetical protein CBER1_02459 [Cercospora berteroae]